MRKTLSIIFLFVFAGCNEVSDTGASKTVTKNSIMNGEIVTADNPLAKSVVSIFAFNNNMWFNKCTASVLSDRMILTAAHCVAGRSPRDFLINFSLMSLTYEKQKKGYALDEYNIKFKYDVRRVRAFRVHPKYNQTENDIAVMLLDETAPMTAIPVKFLSKESITENNIFDVTLMGIGLIDDTLMTESNEMRTVTVPAAFQDNLLITDQREGRGACIGDSGGPAFLMVNGVSYQVGVTHGPHGAIKNCHNEGEFINPSFYLDFIESAKNDMNKTR